jgi:5-methylcytosine-specific restriction endonuclease McrA
MRGRVWCEVQNAKIIRIFKTRKAAVLSGQAVIEYPRKDAVAEIRREVFKLAEGFCKYCGKYVPWESGHMHEQIHRGEGGEISIYNSTWACYNCHKNEHPEKQLRFGEHEV